MKIAVDITPLKKDHYLSHRVRGTGFYIKNLISALEEYYPNNTYTYFTRGENLSKDIDLIHYPYFEPYFLTLPFSYQKRTVVTVHDLTPFVFPQHFPSGIKGKIKWLLQKRNLKGINAIITDSYSSKKDIAKFVGISQEKIHVVYLAAARHFRVLNKQELLAEEMKKKYNLHKKFALYVGDATWNKNLPRLIEAIRQCNIPLVMVGDALVKSIENNDLHNPWNRDLATAKKLILNNKNIFCVGFVPDSDLVQLYNMATIFVMPSLYEGFGLPLLEAMSCGCPVVTSETGSIPEIVGNAAVVVDATDTDSIAQGILKVWNNKTLQEKLISFGRKQAAKFSWRKTAQQTLRAYEAED